MTRQPAVDVKFLEALYAWQSEDNFAPMAKLMRVGFPKTPDETELFRVVASRHGKKRRGRKPNQALPFGEAIYSALKDDGLAHSQAVEATMMVLNREIASNSGDAESLGIAMPESETLRAYLRRSKKRR
jgi:hypothetical protein